MKFCNSPCPVNLPIDYCKTRKLAIPALRAQKFVLGIGGYPTHNSPMTKLHYDRSDYSVVVKNRASSPKAWRREIYRAGNTNPIKRSSIYFDTTASARRAGKDALTELLKKLFS